VSFPVQFKTKHTLQPTIPTSPSEIKNEDGHLSTSVTLE